MNEQLKRIRSKDFTSIDQKLFQNLSRAENLTSTLTHLSDFQKFLMEQISSLNQAPSGNKSSLIAKSIAKNFDDLKESLVKCSRLQIKPERSLLLNLKDQISSLKGELKQARNGIKEQTNSIAIKNSQTINSFMQQFLSKLQNQRKQKEQLMMRCQRLQKDNANLLQQNDKLRKNAFITRQTSIQIEKSHQRLAVHQQKVNTQADYRTPLKQVQFFQRPNSFLPKEQWKATKNQIVVVNYSQQKRSVSKRQTSNHQISRKQHFQCFEKENEMLKAKGVTFQQLKRGKSKQKIKLFSMI